MTAPRTLRAGHGPVHGTVAVPGSKSIANRALVVAALAEGDSELVGVPDGDDTAALRECLSGLGVGTEPRRGSWVVNGSRGLLAGGGRLHAALAGTTSRFVTALAALADGSVSIDGDPPLRARPMAELHDALRSLGASVAYGATPGHLPITVTGPVRRGGRVSLRGDVSSQFITALMLIAPVLEGGVTISLTTPSVSAPYLRLTASVMEAFGATGVVVEQRHVFVPRGRYQGRRFAIEPDASSASYPLAIAAARGGHVTVPGLTASCEQGDIAFLEVLERMGCVVVPTDVGTTVSRDPSMPLRGIDIDMSGVSDLVPTVAVLAVLAETPTIIRGVGFIRSKESDRLSDLARELNKTGAAVEVTPDGLHVRPVQHLHGAALHTHHDHRLAMSFAVLGTVVEGIVVEDPAVVSKSWPGFWTAYEGLLA